MKTFRPFRHGSELMLLPPSIDEWVPAEHEVHFFADAVRQLDLSTIMGAYNEERGAPPLRDGFQRWREVLVGRGVNAPSPPARTPELAGG